MDLPAFRANRVKLPNAPPPPHQPNTVEMKSADVLVESFESQEKYAVEYGRIHVRLNVASHRDVAVDEFVRRMNRRNLDVHGWHEGMLAPPRLIEHKMYDFCYVVPRGTTMDELRFSMQNDKEDVVKECNCVVS